MVKVCDAIMGNGKTQSAITYINEHPDKKFIYITPYLDEAARIKKSCPSANFIEPSNKLEDYGFRKSTHTMALIKQGRNIATTHQAFRMYTQETLDDIKEQGYTLIIDENVDILEEFGFHPYDLQLLVKAGLVKEEHGAYSATDTRYEGVLYNHFFEMLNTRDLIRISNENKENLYYWTIPPTLLTSFSDVFILTYLFEGQSIHHFLEIYDIPYEFIGIQLDDDGTYRFGEYPGYTPEYLGCLKDKIHILESEKLNNIGDDYYAMSMSWYDRDDSDKERLKKNVDNFFRNIHDNAPADEKLWGTFNKGYTLIKGKGYTKSFLTFNAKATNRYRNRTVLVYIANVFMNVNEKIFYQSHGVDVDDDKYALSVMLQWIWRSAIRDGKEVWLYIPSRRMRDLLNDWLDKVSEGRAS